MPNATMGGVGTSAKDYGEQSESRAATTGEWWEIMLVPNAAEGAQAKVQKPGDGHAQKGDGCGDESKQVQVDGNQHAHRIRLEVQQVKAGVRCRQAWAHHGRERRARWGLGRPMEQRKLCAGLMAK